MKKDPTIKTENETDVITSIVNEPMEDEWDNISGDLVIW
jgi:hypothetical protein